MKVFARVYYLTIKTAPVSAIAGLAAWLVQGIMPAVQTVLLERLFDSGYGFLNGTATIEATGFYCLVFLLVYGAVKVLEFSLSITVNAGIYEKCNSFHKLRIAEKTAALPLVSLEDSNVLNLQERAKTCVSRETLSGVFMSSALFIINALSLVSLAVVLGRYHALLVPVSLLSAVPFFIAARLRGREFYYLKQAQTRKSRLVNYLWSLFGDRKAAREMRVMDFGDYLAEKWQTTRQEANNELWAEERKDALSLLACDILKLAAYIASILIALFLALRGEISIGLFAASVAAFKSVQDAAKNLLTRLGRLPEQFLFAKDYFAYLDLEEDSEGGEKTIPAVETLSAGAVSFSYPNAAAFAVEGASLIVRKGEKVAILGENGSGKTTFIKLLLGMYKPESGTVRCNGVPLDELRKPDLYKRFSVVAQNFVPYKLTLRENIAIADTDRLYDDEGIRRALVRGGGAGAFENAASDLETMLGREFGGIELSGGQWQKIAISRGLFRDGELVVLDEPTAALDPIIERDILTSFLEIARDKTAVIISHRVGLCRLVDTVVVMKEGRIVETGSHADLINRGGEYERLYTRQAQWYPRA
jgi:ABC-type multidrug transport system fused ATPase/permease subunit